MDLGGKQILVIGGGSGIGFAVAAAASQAGAAVTVASTSADKLDAAVRRLGERARSAVLDATDEAAVAGFFEGRAFDHIVYTAGDWGGARRGPLADTDLAAAAGLFRVRFWGALAVAKHGAPTLPQNGSITLTDGMIAQRPSKGSVVSSAMAGAVEHMTRALAVELAPIRVNCVCPGLIRTGVWDSIPAERRQDQFARLTARQLLPRIGEPEEAAEAYLYLMRAGYTTGQVLYVEGGSALGQ
ncbi:MAG: SDR family oxidoreductase [Phenylobacterium sp.]|uniref:SDR family oxidoreductase n=1 Tax=Phenylobacterium sp. TaxID=1871053 RepID=UPI001A4F2B5B|nr:SDR family oxidoreductase [Phenylobacterium sp.]MBL8774165.1 SDR family oxidoreductase [Phenylobacterium sp.]